MTSQSASLSNPDSVTLSQLVLSECDFSSAGSPQSRFCYFVRLAVLSECDFPTVSPLVETGLGCQSHRPVRVWLLSWSPLRADPATLSVRPVPSGRDPLTLSVTQSCQSASSQPRVAAAARRQAVSHTRVLSECGNRSSVRSLCRHTRSPQAAHDPVPQRSASGLSFRVPPAGRVARGDSDLRRRLGGS